MGAIAEALQGVGEMPNNDEIKAAMKEALKEWLDEKFMIFGKWSLTAIAAAGLVALVYFTLKMNGWQLVAPK